MQRKQIRLVAIILISAVVLFALLSFAARFVFLSPACYSDNNELTERENYFIKNFRIAKAICFV